MARDLDAGRRRVQTFDGVFADPGTTRGSTSADGVAPRLIASYRATTATRVYGQIAEGFRLGGINAPLCSPQDLCAARPGPGRRDHSPCNGTAVS